MFSLFLCLYACTFATNVYTSIPLTFICDYYCYYYAFLYNTPRETLCGDIMPVVCCSSVYPIRRSAVVSLSVYRRKHSRATDNMLCNKLCGKMQSGLKRSLNSGAFCFRVCILCLPLDRVEITIYNTYTHRAHTHTPGPTNLLLITRHGIVLVCKQIDHYAY